MRWTPPIAALLLAVACAAPPPPRPPEPPARPFDTDRAWQDLEALAAIGSRPTGSEGAARARDHLRSRLEAMGIETREWAYDAQGEPLAREPEPGTDGTEGDEAQGADAGNAGEASVEEALGDEAPQAPEPAPDAAAEPAILHVGGVIPGELDDLVVLAARYDTAPDAGPAANAAASGPALVLELARAIAARPLPYTTWVVFLDGEGGPDGAAGPEPRLGVRAWVGELREEGVLADVRVAMVFRRVADGGAPIVRDLLSHRPYRQVFWEVAEDGEGEAFPPTAGFTSVDAPHTVFLRAGLRRVVAVVGEPPPPPAEGDAEDAEDDDEGEEPTAPPEDTVEAASRERLGTVGRVTLAGLDLLTERLAKVDRLVPEPEPAEPGPAAAAEDVPEPAAAPAPEAELAPEGAESP